MDPRQNNMGGHHACYMGPAIDAGRLRISGSSVSLDGRALRQIYVDETMQRRCEVVRDLPETGAPRTFRFDLNRGAEKHFVLTRATASAQEQLVRSPQGGSRLIDIDHPRRRTGIPSAHGVAQLGGNDFIPAQRESPLQLGQGNSVGIGAHEVGRPKPNDQRQFRAVQDRPRGDGNRFAAGGEFLREGLAAVRQSGAENR